MHRNIFFKLFLASGLILAACGQPMLSQPDASDTRFIDYFSSDYQNARSKFRAAATSAGAGQESFKNPQVGPDGQELFTDVAWLGPRDAETVLVLMSGVHGVEGFGGSGIQVGLLQEEIVSNLPGDTAVLLVHAINPYGFAHLRRVNEDNVDLNRNFIEHGKDYPPNPAYDQLADLIAPDSVSPLANFSTMLQLLWYRLRHGSARLQEAVTHGQYDHPKGLFFGGREAVWSNRTLRAIAGRYLGQAKRVTVIDLHTGLGPYGHGEIILIEPETTQAYRRAAAVWGAERTKSTQVGGSVSAHLVGTVQTVFHQMLAGAEVTPVGLEFGTVPAMEAFKALRAENWLQHHGGSEHADAQQIKSRLLRAFYPAEDDWKRLVWTQGRDATQQVLTGIQ
jgi:hypothetical protein